MGSIICTTVFYILAITPYAEKYWRLVREVSEGLRNGEVYHARGLENFILLRHRFFPNSSTDELT